MTRAVEVLLEQIRAGQAPSNRDVHAALIDGPRQQRTDAARTLATALLRSHREPQRALELLELLWFLGARDLPTLSALVDALKGAGRNRDALDRVREAADDCAKRQDLNGLIYCSAVGFDLGFANH